MINGQNALWFIVKQLNNKLLFYCILMKSFSSSAKVIKRLANISMFSSLKGMFKIHHEVNWKDDEIIKFILNNDNWKGYYAVKLVNILKKLIVYNII